MVVQWNFLDPVDNSTTTFDVNPKEGGSLSLQKNITAQSTVAAGGGIILFEGNEPVQEITFSGTIRTQTQFDDLVAMFDKRHQIQLTDDLGRTFMILITKFDPKRVRAVATPWKHTYTVTATIVDWP
jgi:hypothetical protein